MKFLNSPAFPLLTVTVLLLLMVIISINTIKKPAASDSTIEWQAPDPAAIPFIVNGAQIAYGKQLFVHTAEYLGPKGSIAHLNTGMNCQNCHLQAGTQLFANNFATTALNYPQFSPRSGKTETLTDRINNCMERSLNGQPLDTASKEMEAMIAYINWVSCTTTKAMKPAGTSTEKLPYLSRAASPANGAIIFNSQCVRCHGKNGTGLLAPDGRSYTYPPLWGPNSYNVSAGIYRLAKLAGFIKNNMPYGVTYKDPQLTDTEAWDVAAFINSQPRTQKLFATDWPDMKKKPVDYPFGPYADKFSAAQHRFGPFGVMAGKDVKK